MRPFRTMARFALTLAALALWAVPASATTLVRLGLEKLVTENQQALVGTVVDLRSYWNEDHTFILTDVRFRPDQSLKGHIRQGDVIVTLMGGTVGDLTTLIIAGPELVPGGEYLLFVNPEELPGTRGPRLTVRDLSQGVFENVVGPGGSRFVSQATNHALLPDEEGLTDPPGGAIGFDKADILSRVRQLSGDR